MKETVVTDKKRDKQASELRKKELLDDLMRKRLYSYEEASNILEASTRSLKRAVKAGKLKAIYVGRQRRIPAEEIQRLVQGAETLITVQEAAALAGVSDQVIRALIKLDKIKAFRLANRGPFKIPRTEAERLATEGASYHTDDEGK